MNDDIGTTRGSKTNEKENEEVTETRERLGDVRLLIGRKVIDERESKGEETKEQTRKTKQEKKRPKRSCGNLPLRYTVL